MLCLGWPEAVDAAAVEVLELELADAMTWFAAVGDVRKVQNHLSVYPCPVDPIIFS